MRNKNGVSMVTLIITVIVIIILVTMAMNSSTVMIDKSTEAKDDTQTSTDDDEIRALLTFVSTGAEEKVGLELSNRKFSCY